MQILLSFNWNRDDCYYIQPFGAILHRLSYNYVYVPTEESQVFQLAIAALVPIRLQCMDGQPKQSKGKAIVA